MFRKCPHCGKPVSLWAVLKPIIIDDELFNCGFCNRNIKAYWSETNTVLMIIVGLIWVGLSFSDLQNWLVGFSLFSFTMIIIAYASTPFKKGQK